MEQIKEEKNDQLPEEKSNFFASKFIRFLGGKNLLYFLIITLLIGCIILIFDKISFIFKPLTVLLKVVILPGVLGIILYYLLRPFTRLFDRLKVPRLWGVFIIFLCLIGFFTLAIVLIYPFLRDQFSNLIQEFPIYMLTVVEKTTLFLNTPGFNEFFEKYGFNYNAFMTEFSQSITEKIQGTLTTVAAGVASGVTTFVTKLTSILLSLAIVPFVLFYLLYEGEKMPKFIIRLFPPQMREGIQNVLTDMDKQVSSYIQGQILVSICIGTMVTIGFLIIDLEYALLLGILAMFTSVVPYLGPAIAITPALIISTVTGGLKTFLLVGVVWTIVQLVEGKFISPQIMGKSLKVHPISIIFVLLTAGALFGVPGVLLGIPGYALLKVLVQHGFHLFQLRFNRFQSVEKNEYTVTKKTIE